MIVGFFWLLVFKRCELHLELMQLVGFVLLGHSLVNLFIASEGQTKW